MTGSRAETEPDRKPLWGRDDNKVLIGDVRDGVYASLPVCVGGEWGKRRG